jgi:hypothetical protein
VTAPFTSPLEYRALEPLHPVTAHASGPVPYRTLVIGGRAISDADDRGLVEAFAARFAELTGHGVDVELIAGEPLEDAASRDLVAGRDLSRIDALVVVLDPEHAAVGEREAVRGLLDGLALRLTPGSAIVAVVPSARTAELSVRELDRFTATVRDVAEALTPVVRLEELHGSPAEARVARWAASIAEVAARTVIDPMVRFLPDDPYDEYRRVDAVGAARKRSAAWADRFQDLVETARSTYGTRSAAISVIDDDTTRYVARSGNVAVARPRGKTVCNRVMRIFGGLILGDAQLDPRFSGLPEVRAGSVRFYAGYRITGPDGAPFGALCVFDSEPRVVQDEDLAALRDLAMDAQHRLWTALPSGPTG